MNHQIVYQCYYAFAHRGFSVLRFNFRGVGRSQGSFDHVACPRFPALRWLNPAPDLLHHAPREKAPESNVHIQV